MSRDVKSGRPRPPQKRTLARRAAETYVLASAEKLGAASRYGVLPLADVAAAVTDGQDHEVARQLQDRGVTVLPPQ